MAVMAHPDDAEIWCGGTLILHAEKGDAVRVCTLSYLRESTRGQEAQQGAKRQGQNGPRGSYSSHFVDIVMKVSHWGAI
jgi:LmbE family N-acetylglucosaminyl deacetylase